MPTSLFESEMNSATEELDRMFSGESWELRLADGVTFQAHPAVSVDPLAAGAKIVPGGRQIVGEFLIFIRQLTLEQSGVKRGSVVRSRGELWRVESIAGDGTDMPALSLVSAAVEVKR